MSDRDETREHVEQELARLAAATSDVKPDDGFADAVLRAAADAGDPLARIGRATAEIEPAAAFTDAVMEAVRAEPARPAISEGIVRTGRAAIVIAALAAAASVLLFFRTQSQLDAAIMASVDTIEVSE